MLKWLNGSPPITPVAPKHDGPNRRLAVRIPVRRSALVYRFENGKLSPNPVVCTMQDISAEGARISTDISYTIGQSVMLSFKLSEEGTTHATPGIIVWSSEDAKSGRAYGVRFYGMSAAIVQKLKADLQILVAKYRS